MLPFDADVVIYVTFVNLICEGKLPWCLNFAADLLNKSWYSGANSWSHVHRYKSNLPLRRCFRVSLIIMTVHDDFNILANMHNHAYLYYFLFLPQLFVRRNFFIVYPQTVFNRTQFGWTQRFRFKTRWGLGILHGIISLRSAVATYCSP